MPRANISASIISNQNTGGGSKKAGLAPSVGVPANISFVTSRRSVSRTANPVSRKPVSKNPVSDRTRLIFIDTTMSNLSNINLYVTFDTSGKINGVYDSNIGGVNYIITPTQQQLYSIDQGAMTVPNGTDLNDYIISPYNVKAKTIGVNKFYAVYTKNTYDYLIRNITNGVSTSTELISSDDIDVGNGIYYLDGITLHS